MNLENVARRFDLVPMWDAYNGKKLRARCQVTPWDSPRRDGLTTLRRTLSMAYGAKLPERRAVVIGGESWIIARDPSADSFGRHVIRVGYVAQQAHLGLVGDTTQVLSSEALPVFLSRVWVKDVKDITTTSEAESQYYVYFTEGEPVVPGCFLFIDNAWHICRNVIAGAAGLMIAECNELEKDCLVDVELTHQEWDPVLEIYSSAASETLKGILLSWRDDYRHELPSAEKEQVGDIRFRFRAEDGEKFMPSSRIRFKGDYWQFVSRTLRDDGAHSIVFRRVSE